MQSIGFLSTIIPESYNTACQILAGNAIGEYKPSKALTIYNVTLMLSLAMTLVQMLVFWLAQGAIIELFTSLPRV